MSSLNNTLLWRDFKIAESSECLAEVKFRVGRILYSSKIPTRQPFPFAFISIAARVLCARRYQPGYTPSMPPWFVPFTKLQQHEPVLGTAGIPSLIDSVPTCNPRRTPTRGIFSARFSSLIDPRYQLRYFRSGKKKSGIGSTCQTSSTPSFLNASSQPHLSLSTSGTSHPSFSLLSHILTRCLFV